MVRREKNSSGLVYCGYSNLLSQISYVQRNHQPYFPSIKKEKEKEKEVLLEFMIWSPYML